MKKLLFKITLYVALIVLALEVLVRIFYLGKDMPRRYIDEYEVEKWVPNQSGFSVTGNRRQNFSEFRINEFGFNSYHEFKPTKSKLEIAFVGDSFIEGFHQNYYNSIGKKIENELDNVEVYEYGYAGYDFADQLHLINVYNDHFNLIDHVFIGIKFSNDFTRKEYAVIEDRMNSESTLYRILKKSKLIIYCKNIGVFEPLKSFIFGIEMNTNIGGIHKENLKLDKKVKLKYLENFESLVSLYGFDKNKFILVLETNDTTKVFIEYLEANGFQYIDLATGFKKSKKNTTLIYDRHWNDHGRTIVAKMIADYYSERLK